MELKGRVMCFQSPVADAPEVNTALGTGPGLAVPWGCAGRGSKAQQPRGSIQRACLEQAEHCLHSPLNRIIH